MIITIRAPKAAYASKGKRPQLKDAKAIARYMKDLAPFDRETLWVVTMDSSLRLIKRHLLALGSVDKCLADVREVMRAALLDDATKIALVHNHPAGGPLSEYDKTFHKLVDEAGYIMHIDLVDTVVIIRNEDGEVAYASYKGGEGILEEEDGK